MMKRLITIVLLLAPALLNAGVIMKKSGERIEDVSIQSISGDSVLYFDAHKFKQSILSHEVQAVLYDDGRYEEINTSLANNTSKEELSNSTLDKLEFGVFACYKSNNDFRHIAPDTYWNATIEYRVIRNNQEEPEDFKYLGTTPFVYATDKAVLAAPVLFNPVENIMKIHPLIVDNYKTKNGRLEFRISKDGYQTVIINNPRGFIMGDTMIFFLPLGKLKQLKNTNK